MYHVTIFFLFMSFTVHYFYTKISVFTSFLSIRNVLDCFYLLIFFLFCEILKLNLSFAIIITLNLSKVRAYLFALELFIVRTSKVFVSRVVKE